MIGSSVSPRSAGSRLRRISRLRRTDRTIAGRPSSCDAPSTTSTELFDWRRHIVDGKDDRRDVTIRQLTAPGGKVVHAWRLVRAWPCRWSGPAFDAMSNDVACEELELTFDDLVWLDRNATNPGG